MPAALQARFARKIGTDELKIRIVDPDILIGEPLTLPGDQQRRMACFQRCRDPFTLFWLLMIIIPQTS
jgi:hypothetical protein